MYHVRNSNKRTLSVYAKEKQVIKSFIIYGLKYACHKKLTSTPTPFTEGLTAEETRKDVDISKAREGAFYFCTQSEREVRGQLAINRTSSRFLLQSSSDSRSLFDLEPHAAIKTSDSIGVLSAKEICPALHALWEPESMSAARNIFRDSARLGLDASFSKGLSPVDAGWTFIPGLHNNAGFKHTNMRSIEVELEHVYPSKIEISRDPKSLKTAISPLKSSYQQAESSFFKSGNNDAEFFSYCNGSSVLMYRHHLFESAPHIREAFPRSLSKHFGVSTGGYAPISAGSRRQYQPDNADQPTLRMPYQKKSSTAKSEIGLEL